MIPPESLPSISKKTFLRRIRQLFSKYTANWCKGLSFLSQLADDGLVSAALALKVIGIILERFGRQMISVANFDLAQLDLFEGQQSDIASDAELA